MSAAPELQGTVAVGFERVGDAFLANFTEHDEVGAACCVYRDGEPVVDVWAGDADRATARPWTRDTIVIVFSCTKGVTAVAANQLIEQGRLDPDAPVAEYWPEFAAAGKATIPVAWVLSHRAGLAAIDAPDLTLDDVAAWDPVDRRDRGAGTELGAGYEARLPHPHVRLDHRRADPPGDRRHAGRVRGGAHRGTAWTSTSSSACPRSWITASPRCTRRATTTRRSNGWSTRSSTTPPPCSVASWAARPGCSATTTCGTRGACVVRRCRRRTGTATRVLSRACTRRASGRSTACGSSRRRRSPRRPRFAPAASTA